VDAVIPNGVDPGQIRFVSRAAADDLAVVAGRISPEKGTHLALAACRRAGMRVLVAGDAYDRQYFDQRIAPRLDDHAVRWVGAVSRQRLGALLGRAAVAVVASVWEEPFGMVALEANLAGTPVAGFRRGALPEVVGRRGGVLTDEVGVAGLAAAITAARGCDRTRARRAAETRFPLDAMVNAYRRLYRVMEQDG
jgi:glycosyltransferase involved in cell wall biosynthesis